MLERRLKWTGDSWEKVLEKLTRQLWYRRVGGWYRTYKNDMYASQGLLDVFLGQ